MRRLIHILGSFLAASAVFGGLVWIMYRFEYLVMRELYRGADALGLLTGSGSGAKQVMGLYVSRPPYWLEQTVEVLSALIVWCAPLVIAFALHQRLTFPRYRKPRILRPRWLARVAPLVVIFSMGLVLAREYAFEPVRDLVLELGKSAGCRYVPIGRFLIGEDGPFFGDGWADEMLNWLWKWGAEGAMFAGPFVLVMILFHAWTAMRPLGVGCCVYCGYDLRGAPSDRCPECGREKLTAETKRTQSNEKECRREA